MFGTYSVNPVGISSDSEAPSRGRMDYRTTNTAGLVFEPRALSWFGKAVFAVAALA